MSAATPEVSKPQLIGRLGSVPLAEGRACCRRVGLALGVLLAAMGLACNEPAQPASAAPVSASLLPSPSAPSIQDLADSYVRGSGLWHETLRLDEGGRFERRFSGCLGEGAASGQATQDGHFLVLHNTVTPEGPAFGGVEPVERFLIVPWDTRVHLVPEARIFEFCNAVNGGLEPRTKERSGSYAFVLDGSCSTPPAGRPALPAEWAPCVLDRAVIGTTGEPGGYGTAWVDIGSEDGLLLKMEALLEDLPSAPTVDARDTPATRDERVLVVELEPRRCRVMPLSWPTGEPQIPPGLTVTFGQAFGGR